MTPKMETEGFGAPRRVGAHHFSVHIPEAPAGAVTIAEDLGDAAGDNGAPYLIPRVVLPRAVWAGIQMAARRDFNARLKHLKKPGGRWTTGTVKLERLLGKELCVLAWAAETASKEQLGVIARRWESLRPEERWWLFAVTAAEGGRADDTARGWRRALYHALSDPGDHDEAPTRRPPAAATDAELLPLFRK